MLEVLLMFSMNGAPIQTSDRVFKSYGECAMFVTELVGKDVMNSDYGFEFRTKEGDVFTGQCIARKEIKKKQKKTL